MIPSIAGQSDLKKEIKSLLLSQSLIPFRIRGGQALSYWPVRVKDISTVSLPMV